MVQFLSIIFFLISSIFVGVFKISRFLCHPVYVVYRVKFGNSARYAVLYFTFQTI